MRTDWVCHDDMAVVMRLLMPANALALEVSLTTGLRISDVLSLRRDAVAKSQRVTVKERKTGKSRRVYINKSLRERLLDQSGDVLIFPGAVDPQTPRTRQAVYKDVKRAAKALRIPYNIAPHSARKIYAVDIYRRDGLAAAQKALNHSDSTTTLIYVLSDIISERSGKINW